MQTFSMPKQGQTGWRYTLSSVHSSTQRPHTRQRLHAPWLRKHLRQRFGDVQSNTVSASARFARPKVMVKVRVRMWARVSGYNILGEPWLNVAVVICGAKKAPEVIQNS